MSDPIKENQANDEQNEQFDTSDPKQVNKARKRAARTRADRLEFVAAAMQHEQGRAWFYDHLLFCKSFESPFRDDPYATAFALGHQNIGFKVLDDLQTAAPDLYLKMITENKRKKE